MSKNAVNSSGLFFEIIMKDDSEVSCFYDEMAKFMRNTEDATNASDVMVREANERLNRRLIDNDIAATITLTETKMAMGGMYSYTAELDFKDEYERTKYSDASLKSAGSTGFLRTLASAIAVIDTWLDGIEADRFENVIRKKVLQAGLEFEAHWAHPIHQEQIYTLYSKQSKIPKFDPTKKITKQSELQMPNSREEIFTVSTRDPFYQEKLMRVIEAYAARDLANKISNKHPEMPIVYHHDNLTFEVPWMLKVPFAKAQMKELYNRNLDDLDHGVEMALNMGPVPLTRQNLELLLRELDAMSNSLASKFND